MRYAGLATLAVIVAIALLTVIPGAPLQNPETGAVIGDSPFMDSLIVIIMIVFFAAGLAYGRGAGTISGSEQILNTITKSWSGLASLLFLFLLIAQFIAYFNYSKIPEVAAVKLGDWLEHLNIGAVWLLIGLIIVTTIVNLIIPAAIAKWALLAPIFVPLFLRLGIAPQTVLAAYRVGDSPSNVVTPLMAYFPLIVVFAQRYEKGAGIGTVVSLMLPYVVILSIAWTLFFVAWYLIGIPLWPWSTCAYGLTVARHERQHDHVPGARRRRGAVHLGLLPGRAGGGRSRALAVGDGRAQPVAGASPASAIRRSSSSPRSSS